MQTDRRIATYLCMDRHILNNFFDAFHFIMFASFTPFMKDCINQVLLKIPWCGQLGWPVKQLPVPTSYELSQCLSKKQNPVIE
jgi:hypothetical protein